MASRNSQQGDREVGPGQKAKRGSAGQGAKARRAERRAQARAKALAQEAHDLVEAIDDGRTARREAWPEGQSEFAAARQEERLGALHGKKRELRRAVYRDAPRLEGSVVVRPDPKPGA